MATYFERTKGQSPTTERDAAIICICFHLPICIVKLHSHILHLQRVFTYQLYLQNIHQQGTIVHTCSVLKKNFFTSFFTNLSRLRMVSMALWSSPGGCPALEEVDTRPLPVTAVGEGRPKSILQHKHGTVGKNLNSLRQSSAKV